MLLSRMQETTTIDYIKKETDIKLEGEPEESLTCYDCNVDFKDQSYLYDHLLHHIKQPQIKLTRVSQEPIKITLKSKSNNSFEIVFSPQSAKRSHFPQLSDQEEDSPAATGDQNIEGAEETANEVLEEETKFTFSPNFVAEENDSQEEQAVNECDLDAFSSIDNLIGEAVPEYPHIPGAEPTPPPEPSPEYPKIRIKTGLLKESLTITEITEDNPNGDSRIAEMTDGGNNLDRRNDHYSHSSDSSSLWPNIEDPLRLPETNDKDDGKLLSNLFNSHNDRAKDLGFTTSDSEFISLDRLDERNKSLQVYSSSNSTVTQNSLDCLAGLPMQQLAQQVSRLQPGNGMNQQNVLINIQQFPQAPPPPQQHSYQPPMYPHPPQPMYQPYQYPPASPMYPYPPAPGVYPPHMPPPPRPQMPQHPHQQMRQPMPSMQQQAPPQYRQQMQPRQPISPRQSIPRVPMQRQPIPRQPVITRQRAPMMRPRGGMAVRGPRPRMSAPQNGQMMQNSQGQKVVVKRTAEQIQAMQIKRKRMDLLVPDKHDDADCQVIAVQPKNTGLPQIQSIQGGAPEPADNSVMHLSDSITLSVRNPPPKPASPKKSDAKAVANILATRGITVTAAPKPKETKQPQKSPSPPTPVAINLNSAVSIVPTNKNNSKASTENKLPTVDLTDDSQQEHPPAQHSASIQKTPPSKNNQRGLPFRCDLCPAQYPNLMGLSKHRQSFHKTGGRCEFGIPLIDLKQPGILQKLNTLGISNYIPVSGSNDTTLVLPVVNVNAIKHNNLGAIGATSVLTLGPIRTFPRTPVNHMNK